MSTVSLALVGLAAQAGDEGFESPGQGSFQLPPIIDAIPWLTKPMLMAFLSVLLVAGFYLWTSRKPAIVPDKRQYAGEMAYSFIRNTLARDMLGQQDFMKFVPYLVALFSFILVNNLFGIVPLVQFPTFSHIGWTIALALVTWVVYNGVGISKHGFLGYLKLICWPSGVPWPLMFLVVPLEFLSNTVVRPVTLALRLFANMFAGHLVLLVFTLGGSYLVTQADSLLYAPVGAIAFLMGVALMFLELLVQVIQAYIFTILTASYISGSLAEEH